MNRFDQLTQKIKTELGLFLSISLGVFLFILFFQPFPPLYFNFNNTLLFAAGLAAIIFIFIVLIRSVFPWLLNGGDGLRKSLPAYAEGFIIFIFSTLASEFYLRFVGSISITFFITVKVMIICLAPPLILGIHDKLALLKVQVYDSSEEKDALRKKIERYEDDYLNKTVEFKSENINENFSLHIAEVVFIRSADNYVEIFFKDDKALNRRLIRNTLKSMEQQIKPFSFLIRCHRICIVNIHFVEKLNRTNNSYWLNLRGYDERLPVSRQYLLRLKEALQG